MIYILLAIALCFGLVVLVGAPYLPTLSRQKYTALELLDLKKGHTLLDLGSGDGRILNYAAKKGIKAVGYEINPILVIISHITTFKNRKNVQIIWGNYWKKQWPKADGIFVFLIDKYMEKLDQKLKNNSDSVKLVSFAFKIPDKKVIAEKDGLYLYKY